MGYANLYENFLTLCGLDFGKQVTLEYVGGYSTKETE